MQRILIYPNTLVFSILKIDFFFKLYITCFQMQKKHVEIHIREEHVNSL